MKTIALLLLCAFPGSTFAQLPPPALSPPPNASIEVVTPEVVAPEVVTPEAVVPTVAAPAEPSPPPDAPFEAAAPEAPIVITLVPLPVTVAAAPAVIAPTVPIYSRWYFWTGVGATVAAIAIASAAVALQRHVVPFDAKEACHGPCDACIGNGCP